MYNKGNVVILVLLAYLTIDSYFAGRTVAVYSCKQTIIQAHLFRQTLLNEDFATRALSKLAF